MAGYGQVGLEVNIHGSVGEGYVQPVGMGTLDGHCQIEIGNGDLRVTGF